MIFLGLKPELFLFSRSFLFRLFCRCDRGVRKWRWLQLLRIRNKTVMMATILPLAQFICCPNLWSNSGGRCGKLFRSQWTTEAKTGIVYHIRSNCTQKIVNRDLLFTRLDSSFCCQLWSWVVYEKLTRVRLSYGFPQGTKNGQLTATVATSLLVSGCLFSVLSGGLWGNTL